MRNHIKPSLSLSNNEMNLKSQLVHRWFCTSILMETCHNEIMILKEELSKTSVINLLFHFPRKTCYGWYKSMAWEIFLLHCPSQELEKLVSDGISLNAGWNQKGSFAICDVHSLTIGTLSHSFPFWRRGTFECEMVLWRKRGHVWISQRINEFI